jgi:hypothetical protein
MEKTGKRVEVDMDARRLGRRLKYTWRRLDDEKYQTVRPDGSVCITFGPVHPGDREYFDKLCEEKS